jgi:sugar (pentulose or hexulose) kinase
MEEDEGAALGGALQSVWCVLRNRDSETTIESVVEGATSLDESTRLDPDESAVSRYEELQAFQSQLSQTLEPVFKDHARFK